MRRTFLTNSILQPITICKGLLKDTWIQSSLKPELWIFQSVESAYYLASANVNCVSKAFNQKNTDSDTLDSIPKMKAGNWKKTPSHTQACWQGTLLASINFRMSELLESLHCTEEETEAKRADLTFPKPHNSGIQAGLTEFLPLQVGNKGVQPHNIP